MPPPRPRLIASAATLLVATFLVAAEGIAGADSPTAGRGGGVHERPARGVASWYPSRGRAIPAGAGQVPPPDTVPEPAPAAIPADSIPPPRVPPPATPGILPGPGAPPLGDTLPPGIAGDTLPSGAATDTLPPDAGDAQLARDLENFVGGFADLGVRFRGRMEMGGEWNRFRPCDADVRTTCDPGLFPQLRPDVQFGLDVGGTISERVQVDVDYDETREFSATNNVNVYYEGRPGELLQRLEVGDVTFDLPRSRYLTRGIPSGNFGFRADARLGGLELQTVWAEQSGELATRTLRLGGGGAGEIPGESRAGGPGSPGAGLGDAEGMGGGAPGDDGGAPVATGFVQEDTLTLDDADYVRGQFFFLVDPVELTGHPHVDALALSPADAPPTVAPGPEPIQLYRFEADPVTRQQVEGYIQAEAVAGTGTDEVRESGWFRYLQPGVDYAIHSSGLWITLRRPLTREEMLAVSYVTAAGDTVGTYDPEAVYNAGGLPTLHLLKASGAAHRPGGPTWEREMHQVYRVSSSSDVDPSSVELTVSLGELSGGRTFKRAPDGRDITFLRLFGMDEQSPVDALDRTQVYVPAEEYLLDQPPVSGVFLVFPTLEPFRRPPPLRSEGLTAEETALVLGADANPRIYDEPDFFERREAGLFRLTIPFRIQSTGGISSFSLGALGVRDGSERIYLGDRLLVRDVDYTIDYTVGLVTLLDPDVLFAGRPDAEIRATWEQKQVFQLAPTSVVGLRGHYQLGEWGGIDVLGLHQAEDALLNRPTLGVEPASVTLGGLNTELSFGAAWLDDLLEGVPGLRQGEASGVDVRGELAVSAPEPNTRGAVYVDDFDGSQDRVVSLESEEWVLGSAPGSRVGAEDALPITVDLSTYEPMTWQHTWVVETAAGDSVGVFQGFLPREDIDRQINVVGSQRREPGLLLTFGDDLVGEGVAGGGPGEETGGVPFGETRWRSVTTLLGPSGIDLSRSEFLEFYVAQGDSLSLVVDLGEVSEDAFFVDPDGNVNGTKPSTGEPWGLGLLDQEADPRQGEIWSDVADERGVWGEECLAERARIYRIGDPRANCTRDNGFRDTEDLDENGSLNVTERHVRYVVELDGSSPYLARTREETGTGFRLFRIPLRAMAGTPVGGFSPGVDLRSVEHLRLTVAGDRSGSVVVARMRIVGSRWVKRLQDGVLQGIAGSEAGLGGTVEVGPVSRLTVGPAYSRPPGIQEELDDPTAGFVGEGIEFQEQALAVTFDGIQPGERAEVFSRYPQRPRDFLTYRQARIWAVARRGDWSPDRPLYFFIKVGSDTDNFYLYRKRMSPALDPDAVQPQDWVPEVVVDLERWVELRQEAELRLAEEAPVAGGDPLEVWGADSTYAVVLRDRGRAPNLAAVREISVGVWNASGEPASGELWVNELRLTRGVDETGAVGYAEVDVRAGDFATTRVSYASRGAHFRQLESGPSYQDDRDLRLASTVNLDRFAPESWGLRMPVRVDHRSSRRDPFFLRETDVRASRLRNLRSPEEGRTRVSMTLRRQVPAEEVDSWAEGLLSGAEVGAGYTRTDVTTVTSDVEARSFDAHVGYRVSPEERTVDLVPEPVQGVVAALLPGFLESRLLDARLRWSPERVSARTGYFRRTSRALRFEEIFRRSADAAVTPVRSPRELLETTGHLALQPFRTLGYDVDVLSLRDLLPPARATGDLRVRPLIRAQREDFAGIDFGWETTRTLRTRLDWRPELASWLGTRLTTTTYYGSFRDPAMVERRVEAPGDTTVALQRSVNGRRDVGTSVSLDPAGMVGGDAGAPESDDGFLARTIGALDPLTFEWQDGVTTRFNRRVVDPGALLQLGWAEKDAYRVLGGDTASLLVDRRSLRAGGGIQLPLSVTVRLSYSRVDSRSLDIRSVRALRRETWPDVSARIADLPVPGVLEGVLSRVTLGSGFRRTEQRLTFGTGGAQLRLEESVQVPVEASLSWVGGLTSRYRATFEEGAGRDPTGDTKRDRVFHTVSLSARFLPPGQWTESLERPIQVTVGWQDVDELNCRVSVGRSECIPFVDQRNRSVNLTVDTQVQRLEVGVQSSWVDRQSFVGRRVGSTQFQLGIFGQFEFTAGDLGRL